MDDDMEIPHEWPEARPVIGRRFAELGEGIRHVDNRVTDQGEKHHIEMTSLRQSIQKLHDHREKDILRQGRHHDEIKGALEKESMRSDIRGIMFAVFVTAFFVIPFLYWLTTK